MKHITTEYGTACNLLELTSDDYNSLEPFLMALGIRTRVTMSYYEDGIAIVKIQAENPYKTSLIGYSGLNDIVKRALGVAEREMEPFAISCYKR